MQSRDYLIALFLFVLVNCAYAQSVEKKESMYAPIEVSLCQINQKVASHFLTTGIPDGFNETQFKSAVNEVCSSNPVCMSQSREIFDSYGIRVRKIDDMFSVMLCDKEMKRKILEDFSCNNMRVEVHSWKMENQVPCMFEDNWEQIKLEYCND
jgi:hypothetical protein